MICKAIIKQLPKNGDNHFLVRVPYFEDNYGAEYTQEALLCCDPSIYDLFLQEDVVYVAFENLTLNDPVIIGKLYVRTVDGLGCSSVLTLKVLSQAILPLNTKIGDYTANDFFLLYLLATEAKSGGSLDCIELTQALYDALPASKLTDGILYIITDRGLDNLTAASIPYSNTASLITATNVQNAIDEVYSSCKYTAGYGISISDNVISVSIQLANGQLF